MFRKKKHYIAVNKNAGPELEIASEEELKEVQGSGNMNGIASQHTFSSSIFSINGMYTRERR